jgi:hypothetical protein
MIVMMKLRQIIVIGAAALGYAYSLDSFAQSRPVAFDANAKQAIKRIDVLAIEEPSSIVVHGRAAQLAPGGKTDQKIANAKPEIDAAADVSNKFKEAFARRNTGMSLEFTRQVVDALKSKGYDARVLTGQHLKVKAGGVLDDMGVNSDADAVLDVHVRSAGFLPQQGGTNVLPTVGVEAALISLKDHKTVYRQVFNSGSSLGPQGAIEVLPATESRKFSSRAAVMANVDDAADALREASAAVASRIADQLSQ